MPVTTTNAQNRKMINNSQLLPVKQEDLSVNHTPQILLIEIIKSFKNF